MSWWRSPSARRRIRSLAAALNEAQRSGVGDGLTVIDLIMMERAIALGRVAARLGEIPVGAVVYAGTRIVAEGFNEREATGDPAAHAELLALSRAGRARGAWRMTDCAMAVTLEPCPMCAGAIVNARLGRLVYGTDDPKAGACRTLYSIPEDVRLNHRVELIPGVCAEACRELLQSFFRARRGGPS